MTLFEVEEILDYWAEHPPIGLAFNGFMRGLAKPAAKPKGWREVLGDPFGAGIETVAAPPPPKAEELAIVPVAGYPAPVFDLDELRARNHARVVEIARRNAEKGVR